ncbi:MAG: glutamate 5-kinase [Pseudomonadota bacterium]
MSATVAVQARAALPKLGEAKRIIVKVGSALLVDEAKGHIRQSWLDSLAKDIADLHGRGCQVAVVSSGAIAVGREHLGLRSGALRLEEKQAAAATGQGRLAHAYQAALAQHQVTAAQILLTPEDTEHRRRHLNARATLEQLFALGAVPVINENDTVATAEIRFGDNDRLAARVAQMVSANALVLLSDIDGLYTADPRDSPSAVHVPLVDSIDGHIESMAGPAKPGYSSGGMVTKLAAASIAVGSGCHMAIANGRGLNPLGRLLAMEAGQVWQDETEIARCTWFAARQTPLTARKRWIASTLTPAGTLIVDRGAAKALINGRSLLPAGIVGVEGNFARGDTVAIRVSEGNRFAIGLAAYASADAKRIAGKQSRMIADILGFAGREEMIHRDDLVIEDKRAAVEK